VRSRPCARRRQCEIWPDSRARVPFAVSAEYRGSGGRRLVPGVARGHGGRDDGCGSRGRTSGQIYRRPPTAGLYGLYTSGTPRTTEGRDCTGTGRCRRCANPTDPRCSGITRRDRSVRGSRNSSRRAGTRSCSRVGGPPPCSSEPGTSRDYGRTGREVRRHVFFAGYFFSNMLRVDPAGRPRRGEAAASPARLSGHPVPAVEVAFRRRPSGRDRPDRDVHIFSSNRPGQVRRARPGSPGRDYYLRVLGEDGLRSRRSPR